MKIIEQYKRDFIEFMVRAGVLMFGSFRLKSGRMAPFFINTGKFSTGNQLAQLGYFYATAIADIFAGRNFNVLYGPAYKGIPLSVAAGMRLAMDFSLNYQVCYNRKEAKDHGEGGSLIGYKPMRGDRILLIDDVITAGTSTKESISLLNKECPGALIEGGIISVDRMEKGSGDGRSAIQAIRQDFGIEIRPIVTLDEIVADLHNREIDGQVVLNDKMFKEIAEYRKQFGAQY